MTSHVLRRIRIVVSTVFFICLFVLFVDLRHSIPADYISKLTYLQFIPSFVRFYNLKTIAATGFILVLILTLFSGRTYCSFLCPLGIGQDIFSRFGGRIKKKFRRYGYKKPFTILRYTLLIITLILTMTLGIFVITLLDPFSIFGRFMTCFAKPSIILLNNLLAGGLLKLDLYTISNIPVTAFSMAVYAVPAAFFILIGTLSLTKGRLYCNIVCPVGTFLGLLSKISLYRIKFNESACTRCGRCAVGCKSSCIDFLSYDVDVSRCVDCFNCINICQDKALSYSPVLSRAKEAVTDESKRRLLLSSIVLPYEGNLLIPEVTNDICIGCGHCEFSCPTKPYKAIFADGNAVHKAAKKPENKESGLKVPVEFPF